MTTKTRTPNNMQRQPAKPIPAEQTCNLRTLAPGMRMMQAQFAQGLVTIIHDVNFRRNNGREFTVIFKAATGTGAGGKHG